MTKANLGLKRSCQSCGAKFYDLNRDPIVCPKCNAVFDLVEVAKLVKPAQTVVADDDNNEEEDDEEATLVSLEEVEAEEEASENLPDVDVDEVDTDIGDESDDVFLEEEDDTDDEVTGLKVDADGEDDSR